MISEQFMQLGRWDLRLSPDTPMTIRQLIDEGDQIVITPTRAPFSDYPGYGGYVTANDDYVAVITSIVACARFRGPVLEIADGKLSLSGHGLLWYIGNSDGNGPWTRTATGAPPSYSVTPRTWAQHLTFVDSPPDHSSYDAWGGLIKQSGVSLPSGTYPDASTTTDDLPKNVLQRLLALAKFLDVEFYVAPDRGFHHGGIGALFQTTPQVILQAGREGRDLDLIGLRLVELSKSSDWWKKVYGAYVVYTGGGAWGASDDETGDIHWDADGANQFYEKWEETSDLVDASPVAASILDEIGDPHQVVTATVDTYDPGRWMRPGDYLWVYDPVNEVYDNGQATTYQGQHVTPAKLRLHGMDWSVRQGMGVYLIERNHGPYPGGTGELPAVLDLTDYVEFEDAPCRLDLGAWRRPYND